MAAGATYEPIATTTLGSAQSSISFTGLSGSYTDLRVVFTATPSATGELYIRLNNDSTGLYSDTYLNGSGSAAASGRDTSAGQWVFTQLVNLSSSQPTFFTIDLFSYAGSTYKTALLTASADWNGSGFVRSQVGLYRSTSAITRIDLLAIGANWNAGATATVFGIKAA